mgnify:FL=1
MICLALDAASTDHLTVHAWDASIRLRRRAGCEDGGRKRQCCESESEFAFHGFLLLVGDDGM